jgi:hypothetical protein
MFYEPNSAIDNLWMYGRREMPTSPVVPPAIMFNGAIDGGLSSFNAGQLATTDDRALHMPVDFYGREFALADGFSVEMFFRSDIDRSGAGPMQLLLESDASFRFGIIVNEGGPGNVRFAVNDGAGSIPIVDINSVSSRNYADATWHYLLATFDPDEGAGGQLQLTIANQDASADQATMNISAGFQGLNQTGNGNLLIGRHNRYLDSDPRNFLGLIDEVQISRGRVTSDLRLGALPDDLVFTTVNASQFIVSIGEQVAGELDDLFLSDDINVEVLADIPEDAASSAVSILVIANLPVDDPGTLRIQTESSVNSPGLENRIELFNRWTGQFELIDAVPAPLTDSIVTLAVDGDPARFVAPFSGQVVARSNWYSNSVVTHFPWRAKVDRFVWLLEK